MGPARFLGRPPALCGFLAAVTALACGPGNGDNRLLASGHVEATEVRVGTKVPGRVVELAVREGDAVARDQVLARIDPTDMELALAAARADRELASAELELRLAGARKESIAELAAQVDAARAERDGATRDLERMQALLERGSGTTKGRDDALVRRDVAAGRLAAAEEALARARAGSRAEEIAAARAREAAALARTAQLSQQIEDATIRAPVAGVVTAKVGDAGEIVGAGATLVVVTDLEHAWLTVWIGERDLGRVRIGQEAEVRTDDGESRRGRVEFVASNAEFTPKNVQTRDERATLVFRVKIGLPNQDGLFKPGMPAEAWFLPAEPAAGEAP